MQHVDCIVFNLLKHTEVQTMLKRRIINLDVVILNHIISIITACYIILKQLNEFPTTYDPHYELLIVKVSIGLHPHKISLSISKYMEFSVAKRPVISFEFHRSKGPKNTHSITLQTVQLYKLELEYYMFDLCNRKDTFYRLKFVFLCIGAFHV